MSLIEDVSLALRQQEFVLVTAESCTGGLIASAITDLAGSSDIFDRGFVTYSNQSKMDLLGVSSKTLEAFGAVSEQTAIEMVEGSLSKTTANLSVAVTGIAGPSGGKPDKPVGLVYIGVGIRGQKPHIYQHHFNGSRNDVRQQSVQAAFHHILDLIEVHHA